MQLTGLLEPLRRSAVYQDVLRRIRDRQPLPDQALLRAARPFLVAALAQDLNFPVIVLSGRVDRAYNLTEQLPVWAPGLPVHRFAEPTAIFYERAAWTSSVIHSRLSTLAALAKPVGASAAEPAPPAPMINTSVS